MDCSTQNALWELGTVSHSRCNTKKHTSTRSPSWKLCSSLLYLCSLTFLSLKMFFSPSIQGPQAKACVAMKMNLQQTQETEEKWQHKQGQTNKVLLRSPYSTRFALHGLMARVLLVAGWSLCLLRASFHAYMPFVWRGFCWSCQLHFLWAAVLLSLRSVSACIIVERWTMHPKVKRPLRIWQNNYIVIWAKTDARIFVKQFPRHTEFTSSTVRQLCLVIVCWTSWEWWKNTSGEVCEALLSDWIVSFFYRPEFSHVICTMWLH